MNYDVTIGIPVFKAVNYIRRALQSAFSQDYPSIEFLIVDDGGEDGSMDVVREVLSTCPKGHEIRILSNPQNLGVSASRNRIIEEAKGEYLFFMDADDVIRKDTISVLMSAICRYDAEIAFGSYERVDEHGNRVLFQYPDVQFLEPDALACFAYRKYGGIQASACNYLVKTSIIREHHLRFYLVNFWEDMTFTHNVLPFINRAVLLPEITYHYLSHEGSLSRRGEISSDEIIENFKALDLFKLDNRPFMSKPYYPGHCYVAVMTVFYIICHLIKNNSLEGLSLSNTMLKHCLRHPASLSEILRFRQYRFQNLFLYTLWKMPPFLSISIIRFFGKKKGLI